MHLPAKVACPQSPGYLYIMANHKRGTLYVGYTTNIQARIAEHKSKAHPKSFTARYNLTRLV